MSSPINIRTIRSASMPIGPDGDEAAFEQLERDLSPLLWAYVSVPYEVEFVLVRAERSITKNNMAVLTLIMKDSM